MKTKTKEPAGKVEAENVNIELIKMLETEDAQLLFAVTIYKDKVVASINNKMIIPEAEINKMVQYIVSNYNESTN